jgi:hypothetical protein
MILQGVHLKMASFVLNYGIGMTPLKRHQVGGPEMVQFAGLLILIDMIYKYFGSGTQTHMTLSGFAVFAGGLFLLIWPMSLKTRP